jgi:manganese/iron transport system permease protein/iron/zinc/copper transport system permease protein
MDWLLEPLHYQFVRNALVVCVVAGALCGLLGVYVTLRGMSYIGHGLSHAIFGGAAVCAALGLNFFVGAGVWGLASGVAIGRISRKRAIGADAAIGVVATAGFALGIALLGLYTRVRQSIEATLFGSVLGVSVQDMIVIVAVTAATALVVVACYRPLLFTTFDAEVAEATGVRVGLIDALLMLLLCGAILTSMRVLGVTLISAALVIPPVTARLLTSSFGRMLGLSAALGAAGGGVGMYLSYHLDVSSGATIVLVDFAAFALVYAATAPRRSRRWDPAPVVRLNDVHGDAGGAEGSRTVGAGGGDGLRGDAGDRAGRVAPDGVG